MRTLSALFALLCLDPTADARDPAPSIDATIRAVESMVWDAEATAIAARHGLNVLNVTWEDTGRYKGSSVGPNISDMTIGVRDSNGYLHPMPVMRFDNFTDKTGDVRSDQFMLLTGNEDGDALEAVSLKQVLQNTRSFLHDPSSWAGREASLWASRDHHVLVSAQACFLPVPRSGEATFTPVLYNYQSSPDNPAVLTIVATREGTSMQIIENEGGYMSEPLFFNHDGERAPFTAVRLSEWRGDASAAPYGSQESAVQQGMNNVILVIQVPLKYREPQYSYGWGGLGDAASAAPMAAAEGAEMSRRSDVEEAVVGHGPVEGPFKEIDGLAIERDERFPVRVTVQFYQATSNGVVTDADVARLREQIDMVYEEASYVGSLVTQGYTGRPTEWVSQPPAATAVWADQPWGWLKAY